MNKTILRKIPDEDVFYTFEEEVEVDKTKIIIWGNNNFSSIGDEKLISILEGEYYDDEVGYDYDSLEELNKITGKVWKETTIRGYCQSDWNSLYYVVNEVTPEKIKYIENFYMGKVDEFRLTEGDEDYSYRVLIPHDVVWDGKKSICDYLGLTVEDTIIYKDDGYEKVYRYKEIN